MTYIIVLGDRQGLVSDLSFTEIIQCISARLLCTELHV